MKPESYAWLALQAQAASLLRPGFPERVVRAARAAAPTFVSQCLLSAATAAVCLVLILFVHARLTANETARNLAGWQAIAVEMENIGQR
jgi:hypothetical protein